MGGCSSLGQEVSSPWGGQGWQIIGNSAQCVSGETCSELIDVLYHLRCMWDVLKLCLFSIDLPNSLIRHIKLYEHYLICDFNLYFILWSNCIIFSGLILFV